MTTGKRAIQSLVKLKRRMLSIKGRVTGQTGMIRHAESIQHQVYGMPGKHVFFGYYDLAQFNTSGSRMLAHIVNRNADPSRDAAQIAWIDPTSSTINPVTETKAWSWQQGARLRWHPLEKNSILFNDVDNGGYVFKKYDLEKKRSQILCEALYDVDPQFRYGIAVNFERLQRLRPGYGYSRFGDVTKNEKRPSDDGVVLIDLRTEEKKLLFSLRDLSEGILDNGEYHYINHICFSPSGSRFMFFHLWTKGAGSSWHMRFCVCGNDGSDLKVLEDDVRVSHYHWINDGSIIATRLNKEKVYDYVIYDVCGGGKEIVSSPMLKRDGHPNLFGEGFITDTYPQADQMQHIYASGFDGKDCKEIAHLYSEPTLYGEHRCDLHPRVYDNRFITVDSTFNGSVRSIVCFTLRK